jgi:hypothetical protein
MHTTHICKKEQEEEEEKKGALCAHTQTHSPGMHAHRFIEQSTNPEFDFANSVS